MKNKLKEIYDLIEMVQSNLHDTLIKNEKYFNDPVLNHYSASQNYRVSTIKDKISKLYNEGDNINE